MKKLPPPEWSAPFDVGTLGAKAVTRTLTAPADAAAALSERFEVLGLRDIQAQITLERVQGGHVIKVTGHVTAQVDQECGITLALMTTHAHGNIEAYFAESSTIVSFAKGRAEAELRAGETEIPMTDEVDAPEPIVNGIINLGEVAAQFLSLAIDPYPRSVPADEDQDGISVIVADPEPARSSPFDQLRAWRDKL
jgi:hypothetical protein